MTPILNEVLAQFDTPTGAVDQSQVRQAPMIRTPGNAALWAIAGSRTDRTVAVRGFRLPALLETARHHSYMESTRSRDTPIETETGGLCERRKSASVHCRGPC